MKHMPSATGTVDRKNNDGDEEVIHDATDTKASVGAMEYSLVSMPSHRHRITISVNRSGFTPTEIIGDGEPRTDGMAAASLRLRGVDFGI